LNSFTSILKARILQSELTTRNTRNSGRHISGLKCPNCGEAEAWAYGDAPFAVICNNQNKCGVRTRTLELFPDLLLNIEEECPPLPEDRHRPATEYLKRRGLNKSLEGLQYEYWPNVRKTGSGAVMFHLGQDKVWNGRIFNPPPGEGKTHNFGSTAGRHWKHPGIQYDPQQQTYVVEGILDALSLIELGHQAIAVLSAGQDPSQVELRELAQNLTIAFDRDTAGAGALKKWKKVYPNAKAMMPLHGDWNDLLTRMPTNEAGQFFRDNYELFEVQARLALAESAYEYANIYCDFHERAAGLFEFDSAYYFSLHKKGDLLTYQVSDFTLKVEHFRLDDSDPDEPTNRYYLRVRPRRGRESSFSVSGSELAAPGSLRAMFLTRARVLWFGDGPASTALARLIVEKGAPIVRELQTIGLDRESHCYVFKTFCINQKGCFLLPNKYGFFQVTSRDFILPANYPSIAPKKGISAKQICDLIFAAWGFKGIAAISFVVAGWFVSLIKLELGFFPFLSFRGDTQTGKTWLSKILNAVQCLDEEGLPIHKVNTSKGEIRKLGQRSSLFKSLLEGNSPDQGKFDYDSLLTLYNANPLQTRARKSNDLKTNDIPFQASILFVQNREPFKTRAQKERVVSLDFCSDDINAETTKAFKELMRTPLPRLAHFFVEVMQHREFFESAWENKYEECRQAIQEAISDPRVSENHGMILAFYNLLKEVLGLDHDLAPYVKEIAKRKAADCAHQQEMLSHYFFSALNELDELKLAEVIEVEGERLYVVLPKALKFMRREGLDPGRTSEVQAALKDHPAFIKSNVQHWGQFNRQEKKNYKVWIFQKNLI